MCLINFKANDLSDSFTIFSGGNSVMKAFLIATALVVGGATVVAGVVGSKLQIRSVLSLLMPSSGMKLHHWLLN